MMSHAQLKFTARGYLRAARPAPLFVGIVAMALMELINYLSLKITNYSELLQATQTYSQSGDAQAYLAAISRYSPSFGGTIMDLLLQVMGIMITTGITIFVIRTVRDGKGSYGNLLDGFPILLRIIGLYLVQSVFIFLWSLLFVIPGIVASYRYSQAIYILLDHPEMGIMDCIRASKHMMNGNKWDYFVLELSFLGWSLLLTALSMLLPLPLLLLECILIPLSAFIRMYMEFTFFLYYEGLHGVDYDSRVPGIEEGQPTDGAF